MQHIPQKTAVIVIAIAVIIAFGAIFSATKEKVSTVVKKAEENRSARLGNDCVRAGCSSHLCVSKEDAEGLFTTCEYRPEYACYQNALCERQENGECGFTENVELQNCLEHTK